MPLRSQSRRSSLLAASVVTALLMMLFAGCDSAKTQKSSAGSAAENAATDQDDSASPEPASKPSGEPVADDGTELNSRGKASTAPPAPSVAGDDSASQAAEPKAVAPGVDPLLQGEPRKDTSGWWRIVFSVPGRQDLPSDYSAGFAKIGKSKDGKYQLEEVRTNDIVNPAKVARSEVTDKTVRIFFEHDDNKFDYAGTLDNGMIRGNLQFTNPRQILVRFAPVNASVATDDKELEALRIGTTFGSEEILGLLQGEDRVDALQKAAKVWIKSPVLFSAYDMLLQNSTEFKLDRPAIEQLSKGFETAAAVWGDRAVQSAKLNTAADLLLSGTETDLAEAKLAEVKSAAPELLDAWQELIKLVRERGLAEKLKRERTAAIDAARKQIENGESEQGIAALRKLHTEQPADPVATYRLATALRDAGSADEALDLFARLAVLPQTELELAEITAEPSYLPPRVVAARLYEKANGNRDGFDDYLHQIYKTALTSFLTDDDRNRQPTESGRVALLEMFTGAACPPCVAADVATDAIEQTFPAADVVALRYHVHIPGPDPLSSSDSLARASYYAAEVQGTPTILIDGERISYNVGGAYSGAPAIYDQIAGTVGDVTAHPPQGTVNLKASLDGDSLNIDVSAEAPEKPADTVRLRLVIAESDINYTASNGIKEHAMVVREMPGGAEGIAAVEGKFTFQQKIPLVELRDRLNSGLNLAEKQLSVQFEQKVSFRTRPLDLRRLTVVAFLQDDTTREVLQTAVVPIEGEVELPPLAAETKAPSPAPPEGDTAAAADPADEPPADESSDAPAGPALTPPQ